MNPNMMMFAKMAAPGGQMPPGAMAALQNPDALAQMMQGAASSLPAASGMPPTSMGKPQAPRPGPQAPSQPVRPPMPQRNPASVIRPVGRGAAAKGRGGDTLMAHMTPGEIAVPPQVQTPEVLATLNNAFAQAGANPTSYQAGHPDQKINPETGDPEFGFFDSLLPMALGLAGSAFLGPAIGPLLGIAEGAGGLMGAIPGALGGAVGSIGGNLLTGKGLGESLAMGAGGAAGGLLGGQLLGGGLGNLFGTGATEVGPGAGGGFSGSGGIDSAGKAFSEGGYAGGEPSFFSKMFSPRGIGSALGGALGSNLAQSMFAPPSSSSQKPGDLGPGMRPLSELPPLSNTIGGGASGFSGPISRGAQQFPYPGYRPGFDPQFRYF